MAEKTKLITLLSSNSLPASEKLLADSLYYCPDGQKFLSEAKGTDIVVVTQKDFNLVNYEKLLTNPIVRVCILPVAVQEPMTISALEVSRQTAITVCSLLRKVFAGSDTRPKGVVAMFSGIAVNRTMAPGAMIWKMKNFEFVCLTVSHLSVMVSAAYADSFTMNVRGKMLLHDKDLPVSRLTPSEVIQSGKDIIDQLNVTKAVNCNVLELALSLVPQAYHMIQQRTGRPMIAIKNKQDDTSGCLSASERTEPDEHEHIHLAKDASR